MPVGLTLRVAQDVMRMCENEPCGLRGCVLYVLFDDGKTAHNVDTVVYDPATAATHELTLTLREDTNTSRLGRVLPRCLKRSHTMYLSNGYQLVKRKLYRRNDSVESLEGGDYSISAQ